LISSIARSSNAPVSGRRKRITLGFSTGYCKGRLKQRS
jgi:hypothetical protein